MRKLYIHPTLFSVIAWHPAGMPATAVHVRVCQLTLLKAQDVAALRPSSGRYDESLPRRTQSALRPPARDQPAPDSCQQPQLRPLAAPTCPGAQATSSRLL